MRQQYLFSEFDNIHTVKPVNVASVPHRSPFRYPGGKTWLVPQFRCWIEGISPQPRLLVEPFAGGGIIGLTAAFENLVDKIVMVELDRDVASVWETIFSSDVLWLIEQICSFELNVDSVIRQRAIQPQSRRDRAFQTLLKNRTAHGGIMAEGAGIIKNGENGKGIHSRWYPATIAKRIAAISAIAAKIEFIHADAFEIIEKYRNDYDVVFFIDPPYTAGGKRAGSRLYNHSQIDHQRLFALCKEIKGKFLMTYDNANEVKQLADQHGFQMKAIPMKNSHHAELNELIISNCFPKLP